MHSSEILQPVNIVPLRFGLFILSWLALLGLMVREALVIF